MAAAPSFAALLWSSRRRFTARGTFGAANAVTVLRLLLILLIGAALHRAPAAQVAGAVLLVFALDGLDGWLARRSGTSAVFGAHFDMETDALLVLIVTLELWTRARLGAWIVLPGALRYLYVLCLFTLPPKRGPAPRSRLGRYAFSVLMAGLIAPLLSPAPWAGLLALGGTVATTASFVRGFAHSYAPSWRGRGGG